MTIDEQMVTMLKDLNAKVDALQRSQATIKSDMIDQIVSILESRWKDDKARRRERTW